MTRPGRPRLAAEPAANVTVRIPPDLREAMESDAVKRRESIGEYIRAAIKGRICCPYCLDSTA